MIVKLYNIKCPNCGAALATDIKNNRARCEYCGNEFYISEETETPDRHDKHEDGEREAAAPKGRASGEIRPEGEAKERKHSRMRDAFIVSLFLLAGLALSFFFDTKSPGDIVPKTELHRFFMELQPDSTPQSVEALAQKHGLRFFRMEKAVNSGTADILCYKIAKTAETALDKPGAHAETVEVEFDMARDNAFRLAVYSDPEHIVSRALLFRYGTYYSLSAEEAQVQDVAGYYYYNNSLRSAPGERQTHPPYLKCADAAEALRKIYTYRK